MSGPEFRDLLARAVDDEPAYPEARLTGEALRQGRTLRRRRTAVRSGLAVAALTAAALVAVPLLDSDPYVSTAPAEVHQVTDGPTAPHGTGKPLLAPSTDPTPPATLAPGPAAYAAAGADVEKNYGLHELCLSLAQDMPPQQISAGGEWLERTKRPNVAVMRVLVSTRDTTGISAVLVGPKGEVAGCDVPLIGAEYPRIVQAHQRGIGDVATGRIQEAELTSGATTPCQAVGEPPKSPVCPSGMLFYNAGVVPQNVARVTVTSPWDGKTTEATVSHGAYVFRHLDSTPQEPTNPRFAHEPTFRLYDAAGKLLRSYRGPDAVG